MIKTLIAIALIIMLGFLQYRLWIEQNGVKDTMQLKNEIQVQQQANQQMEAKNKALMAEVVSLKHGNAAIEEEARTELGMIKKGEQFYQIVKPKHTPQQTVS